MDVPMHMALPDERPGKLCVSYNKQTAVDAIDEVMGGVQRIPNLDTAKVWEGGGVSLLLVRIFD